MDQLEKDLNSAQDAVLKKMEEIGRGPGGRQLSLVNTKIEEAMLWLAAFDKTQEPENKGISDGDLGEALTRLTAFGLGNKEALRQVDADRILTHFVVDEGEEGGKTYSDLGNQAIKSAVVRESLPLVEDEHLIERNELGARHPDEIKEPTIKEEEVR